MGSGIEVVGVTEDGWQINELGQHINNPIEKVKQFMDAKGAGQKDQIKQGETAILRLAEAQGRILKLDAKYDDLLETVNMLRSENQKQRTDIKTLREIVDGLVDRLPE